MDTPDKFVDLDAVLAEHTEREKPFTVQLYGREWTLPGTPPAAFTIRLARLRARGSGRLSAGDTALVMADMVPAEVLSAWCDLGLDTDEMSVVAGPIIAKYQEVSDRIMGEGRPPKVGGSPSSTSSPDGPSSRPTSSASTASTSASPG